MSWNQWAQAFERRKRPERLIWAVIVSLVLLMLFDALWLSGQQQAIVSATGRLAEAQNQQQILVATLKQLQQRLAQDPDAELRQTLTSLNTQRIEAQQQLQQLKARLVDPELMPKVLQDTLQAQPGVQLVRVVKLPTESLAVEGAETAQTPTLYRHPIRLELIGSYAEIQAYLQRLERLPWQFYWQRLDYQVENYPLARVIIELYTLGATEDWLRV